MARSAPEINCGFRCWSFRFRRLPGMRWAAGHPATIYGAGAVLVRIITWLMVISLLHFTLVFPRPFKRVPQQILKWITRVLYLIAGFFMALELIIPGQDIFMMGTAIGLLGCSCNCFAALHLSKRNTPANHLDCAIFYHRYFAGGINISVGFSRCAHQCEIYGGIHTQPPPDSRKFALCHLERGCLAHPFSCQSGSFRVSVFLTADYGFCPSGELAF